MQSPLCNNLRGLRLDHCCMAGEAHWHVLLRARAIETQAYVLAAAQARQPSHQCPATGCAGQMRCDLVRINLCFTI